MPIAQETQPETNDVYDRRRPVPAVDTEVEPHAAYPLPTLNTTVAEGSAPTVQILRICLLAAATMLAVVGALQVVRAPAQPGYGVDDPPPDILVQSD